MDPVITDISLFVVGSIGSIIWWILRNKDTNQDSKLSDHQELIDLLFVKHDADVQRLTDLELEIAKKHYERTELDARFDKLEKSFKEGFSLLGDKLDKLSEKIIGASK